MRIYHNFRMHMLPISHIVMITRFLVAFQILGNARLKNYVLSSQRLDFFVEALNRVSVINTNVDLQRVASNAQVMASF